MIMTDSIEQDNVGGCPDCGYYGSRSWTEHEDDTEFSVTECQRCGYREVLMVDENGNSRTYDYPPDSEDDSNE